MNPSNLVITGVGVVSSIGCGRHEFTESLNLGKSGIRRMDETLQPHALPRYQPRDGQVVFENETSVGAPIIDFQGKLYVKPRKALKVMCREIQTAFAASQLAVTDAGLDEYLPASPDASVHLKDDADPSRVLRSDRVGTVFGSEMLYGDPDELKDAFAACIAPDGNVDKASFGNAAMRGITPLWMLKYLPNMPACHFGIAVAAHGPNNTLTLGDVSGVSALMEAAGYLQRGIADVMIVSGCGTRLNTTRSVFSEDQPLATEQEVVALSSRPHAVDADGVIRGEAAGSLILESADFAAKRCHTPIAEVVGYSSRFVPSDAFLSGDRSNDRQPKTRRGSAGAIIAAISAAMTNAGIETADLGAVVGHAMGDPVIDAAEARALGDTVSGTPACFPMTNLGHTGAASGMMGLLAACAIIESGQIPPTPHASLCSASLGVSDSVRPLKGDYVLAVAHTSPGSATAVVIKRSKAAS